MPSLMPPVPRGRGSSAAPSDNRSPSPQRMVLHYAVEGGARDDLCSDLAHRSGLTKSRIKQALSKGAVWIKRPKGRRRRVRRATTRLHSGDRIEFYYDAAILARQPPASECIDDHRCFSVWYKPAVTRYRAVCYEAALDRTVVEIRLETGRRHQLRRHFDAIGHPVLGDPRYGDGNQDPSGLQLWASSLAFTCPQCRRVHVYTRLPALAAGDRTDVIRNDRPGETHS